MPYRLPVTGALQLVCELCGGDNPDSARLCTHCGSTLCTVRCAHCYQMNPTVATQCATCGQELGLEPIERGEHIDCVDCGAPMRAFNGDPGVLFDCELCGGQFVDHELLCDLLERRTLYGNRVPAHLLYNNPASSPVRYYRCPACQAPLRRQNFGGRSGVIVDVCATHGTWFHPGELPRVLAFVAAGGLREAKRGEMGLPPELSPEQRRALGQALRATQKRPAVPLESTVHGAEGPTSIRELGQDVFEHCKILLEATGRLLGKR